MNLLASYNWIREYVGVKENAEGFARRISLSGPAAERLYPQARQFDRMVVGQILEVKAHPNPKVTKVRLASVDIGESAPLELICGGSNLEPKMKVAVALVGSKVRWHGQGDLIELAPAVIQGVESKGMICGANEIDLADAFPHAEREILDLSWCKAKAGTPLANALEMEDTVFDIEVTTNRPDAFCVVGIAREAAAIFDAKFLWREPVLPALAKGSAALPLTVKVSEPHLCTRYQAVAMTVDADAQSPWWMKRRLVQCGLRPISAIVDITNYVMLEYGQPMHAFDYDKLAGNAINVRSAKAGEKMLLLDGGERTLAAGQLVIADGEKPVAVAGVMGGEGSGVTAATTRIVFEAATFDPVSVRRTARALVAMSDSSLRFEKGLPEELTSAALARAVELCQTIAGGKIASRAVDITAAGRTKARTLSFRPERAEKLIGVPMQSAAMKTILKSLGFGVTGTAKKFAVTVPYWRARDIEGERDLVEEIARVHGYANLPSVMPAGEIPVGAGDHALDAEDRVKQYFRGAGFTELLNYSLVPKTHFEKAGLDAAHAVRIANPLSADFEYLRTSLVPGILQTIRENEGLFPEGRVFEVSKVYHRHPDALPNERVRISVAIWGHPTGGDTLFRTAKGALEALASEWGVMLDVHRADGVGEKFWHPGRSVRVTAEGVDIGALGEIHPAVLSKFGVDGRVALFEIDLSDFLARPHHHAMYVPIPPFPPAKRDLALVVPEAVEYADVHAALRNGSALLREVELFDVYRGKGVEDGKKSMAMHLTFALPDRTLTAEEIDTAVAALTDIAAVQFGASRR